MENLLLTASRENICFEVEATVLWNIGKNLPSCVVSTSQKTIILIGVKVSHH